MNSQPFKAKKEQNYLNDLEEICLFKHFYLQKLWGGMVHHYQLRQIIRLLKNASSLNESLF